MAKLFYSAIDLKQNQLQRAVIHNIEEPTSPVKGQIYYDTGDDILKYYNDSEWISVTANTNTQDDTDLGETPAVGSYTITSSTGDNLSMSAADTTNWGIMTDDHATAIGLNTDKATNVSTALSTGTVDGSTYGITSDGGTDDVIIAAATTSAAGVLTSAKFDEIAANTQKNTNVSTALSTGTVDGSTYGITSDGGTDDVIIAAATTSAAGVLTSAKFDEIAANTQKNTNVSTALSTGTVDGSTYGITSDGGTDDVIIAAATTSAAGVMTSAMFDANADITNKANKASPAFTGDTTHTDAAPSYVMTDTSNDVTGPLFRFEKNPVTANSAGPGDSIGMFSWLGYNAADTAHEYASLEVLSTTTTTDAERGRMDFAVMAGGTLTHGFRIGGTDTDGIIDITLGAGTTSTVTIPGNLVVTGTTITQNETISVVENNTILFEGTLDDDHETKLTVAGPTADRTITLPDATGTVALANGSSPGSISIDTTALSGATVISDLDFNVTTDAQGIVTSAAGAVSTRDLTLGDLGYSGSVTANEYVHPTGAGNKHVPTGGSAGEFLKYDSSGTAVWATPSYVANTNTQLNAASQLIAIASVNATTKRAEITHGFTGGAMAVTLYETSDASGNSTYPWNEVNATVSHASNTVLHVSFDTLPTNDIMAVMVQADGTASSIAYPTS